MGVYGTSTWAQGHSPTPSAHPPPASSNCAALPTVSLSAASAAKRDQMVRKRLSDPEFPGATPAPLV